MKKEIKNGIIIFISLWIAMVLMLYVLFAFAFWQTDPSLWEENKRILFASIIALITFISAAFATIKV